MLAQALGWVFARVLAEELVERVLAEGLVEQVSAQALGSVLAEELAEESRARYSTTRILLSSLYLRS